MEIAKAMDIPESGVTGEIHHRAHIGKPIPKPTRHGEIAEPARLMQRLPPAGRNGSRGIFY